MDTIEKHARTLTRQFAQHPAARDIVASAKALAHLVLSSDQLMKRHKKKMLSEVLWLISAADGKHSTRYRSEEVVRLATHEPTSQVKIQHEHVHPRKRTVERLLRMQAQNLDPSTYLDEILDETTGCVVTAEEHKLLIDTADGWDRYATVAVLDMSTAPPERRLGTGTKTGTEKPN